MKRASAIVKELSGALMLGTLLEDVRRRWGAYELVDHWQQGEFHHDVVVRVPGAAADLGGDILIVSTNCNGGVKEVLSFPSVPERLALWHWRCPENPDFAGILPPPLSAVTTEHWFNPCELLTPDTRSEYRAEHRQRQCGGGWLLRK